jgi:hypothetical protein
LRLKTFLTYASAAGGLAVLLVVILACGGAGSYYGDGGECAQPAVGTHATPASGFGCHILCAPGYFDCDGDNVDGCESSVPCGELTDGAPPPALHLVTTLTGMPHGISSCGGTVYFFDDATLMTTAGQKLVTLPAIPAGGIACDGVNLYFATLSSNGDAGPSGVLYQFHPGGGGVLTPIASGVDPGRGVDTRGTGVYWIARSGLSDAGPMLALTNDAGTTAILPAIETTTYKSFALLDDTDYALSGGSLWASPLDGGAPFTLGFDAGNARALLHAAGPLPVAVVTLDAGDGVIVTDNTSVPFAKTPRIVATAADATHAVFATDDAVYEWNYNGNGVQLLSSPYLHITDITLDSSVAYWVTRGVAATPGAVWRAGL